MGEMCKGYQILETNRKTPVNRHGIDGMRIMLIMKKKKYDSAYWM
jgi:hypothetical protein